MSFKALKNLSETKCACNSYVTLHSRHVILVALARYAQLKDIDYKAIVPCKNKGRILTSQKSCVIITICKHYHRHNV